MSAEPAEDIADRGVELRQIERLVENRRVHPLKETLDRRIVLVAGKKDEALAGSRPMESRIALVDTVDEAREALARLSV